MNKILIIDGHNIAYTTMHSSIKADKSDNGPFVLWKHNFMNYIFSIIDKNNPDRVIITFDSHNSWRYKIFPSYKSGRKVQKAKSDIKWQEFYKALEDIKNDIQKTFKTIYVLQVDECEGDDIVAVICKNHPDKDIIIASSDSDFNQLLSNKVKKYHPIKCKFVECLNPEKELAIKLIIGDKQSDSIPPIRKGIGPVNAEKILNEGLDKFLADNDLLKNYELNRNLIDFNYIPQDIVEKILNIYNSYQTSPLVGMTIVNFFIKNRLSKLLNEWESRANNYRMLK